MQITGDYSLVGRRRRQYDARAMHDDLAHFPDPPSRLDAAPLYVSLFLVLLVFFIVLNSVSQPQPERQNQVLQGMAEEFPQDAHATAQPPPIAIEPDQQQESGERLVGQVQKTTASYLDLTDVNIERQGERTVLELPTASLFKKNGFGIRADRAAMFDAMAALLTDWQPPYRLEIECSVGLGQADAEARMKAVSMASALVKKLIERGAPPLAVVAGITPGKIGIASFTFTLRPIKPAPAPVKASE